MSRIRELSLLSPFDSARLAARFPRAAIHLLRDCVAGTKTTSFPRRLGLFITNRCDFACPMCAVQDTRDEGLDRGGDMPFELLEQVLDECSPYQPVVDFVGGEPLLYPHLIRSVKHASKRNVFAAVTTNGLKLKDKAAALVDAQLPLLQVSLDGWDDKSQEARGRVKGSFDKLRDGIRAVQAAKGSHPFPIIRILTAITRNNYRDLDRIQSVIADLGVSYWGISNYFYLNRNAHERHQAFALLNGLSGFVAAHPIPEDTYLTPDQVGDLKESLKRVKQLNRRLELGIAYSWSIDLDAYYSTQEPSRSCVCDVPYARFDIQTDGQMLVCVSGKRMGQVGQDSIAEVWHGKLMTDYRNMYERTRPMPMCFRCCGLSQTIKFDGRSQKTQAQNRH